jgi:DNA-binding CsgD family transcriptional regulator
MRCELDAAERQAAELAELANRFDLGTFGPATDVLLAVSAAFRGDRAGALSRLESASPQLAHDREWTSNIWGYCHAVLALGEGDRERARAALRTAVAAAGPAPLPTPPVGLLLLLETLRGGPDDDPSQLLRAPDTVPHVITRGLAQVASSIVDGRAGRTRLADGKLETGIETLSRAPWYRSMALALVEPECRAHGWGELPRFTAWSSEVTVPAPPPTHHGVTRRELDVAKLVRDGLSNREIAARLGLSVRTVDKHVERLLHKTGSRNRTALAIRMSPVV